MRHERILTELALHRDPRFPAKERFADLVLQFNGLPGRNDRWEFTRQMKRWLRDAREPIDYLQEAFRLTNEFYPDIHRRAFFWLDMSLLFLSLARPDAALDAARRAWRDFQMWVHVEWVVKGRDEKEMDYNTQDFKMVHAGVVNAASLMLEGLEIPHMDRLGERVEGLGGFLLTESTDAGTLPDKAIAYLRILDYMERMFGRECPTVREKVEERINEIYRGWGEESGLLINSRHAVWSRAKIQETDEKRSDSMKHTPVLSELALRRDPRFPPKDRFTDIVLAHHELPIPDDRREFTRQMKLWHRDAHEPIDYFREAMRITNEFYPDIQHRCMFWLDMDIFFLSLWRPVEALEAGKRALRDFDIWTYLETNTRDGKRNARFDDFEMVCNGVVHAAKLMSEGKEIPRVEKFGTRTDGLGGLLLNVSTTVGTMPDKVLAYRLILDYTEEAFGKSHPEVRRKMDEKLDLIHSLWGGESGYFINSMNPIWRQIET